MGSKERGVASFAFAPGTDAHPCGTSTTPGGIMWVTLALILSEPWGVSTITRSPSLIPLAAASRGLILARGSGSISLSQGSSLCLLWV
jgi:hypothetical protein